MKRILWFLLGVLVGWVACEWSKPVLPEWEYKWHPSPATTQDDNELDEDDRPAA